MSEFSIAVAVVIVLVAAACATARTPLGEMMALSAGGEVACVRNDVVVRGRECR